MPFLITRGLGSLEDGSGSALLSTMGLGDPGGSYVPPGTAFLMSSVRSYYSYLIATFNMSLVADGPGLRPSAWSLTYTDPTGAEVIISLIEPYGSNAIKLYVSEQTDRVLYTLRAPEVGITSTTRLALNAPYYKTFYGSGTSPNVVASKSIDARHIDVFFTENVMDEDASDITNYSIAPTLTIHESVKITDSVYRLTTSKQTELVDYTVTVSNIRDLAHNPIL
jgi:hypothetical protein